VVLTRAEVNRLFQCLSGEHLLMAKLLYGSGFYLPEALSRKYPNASREWAWGDRWPCSAA
jgi:hypothetical protein